MKIGIIGAGIIGSYIAWKLAEKGFNVTVFEQKKKIGKEACSGLISRRLWDKIPTNKKLEENLIRGIKLKFPKKTVDIEFYPTMLAIKRDLLDKYVVNLAEKSGAKILLGKKLKRIFHVKGKKPTLMFTTKKRGKKQRKYYEFDYLIGCDGPLSTVRKSLKLKPPELKTGIFTYVNKKDNSDKAIITAFKNGFGWVLPRGKKIEVGVLEKPNKAKKIFGKFCKTKKIKPKEIYSALIPEGLIISNHDRIALCGDASGLTKPWSSGGIIWELTAADILIKNFPDIKKFNSELKRFFEPRIIFSKLLTKLVLFAGFNLPFFLPKQSKFDPDWAF